jgi:hypothetical protein
MTCSRGSPASRPEAPRRAALSGEPFPRELAARRRDAGAQFLQFAAHVRALVEPGLAAGQGHLPGGRQSYPPPRKPPRTSTSCAPAAAAAPRRPGHWRTRREHWSRTATSPPPPARRRPAPTSTGSPRVLATNRGSRPPAAGGRGRRRGQSSAKVVGSGAGIGQMCNARPSERKADSCTASPSVGWAWMMPPTSSSRAPISIA